MIAVSGCLAGIKCRYDGGCRADEGIARMCAGGGALPICPEMLGGLGCPRSPAEIVGGDGRDVLEGRARVLTADGRDVTEQFVRGAHEALRLCIISGADSAVLKERSPSCGVKEIHDGGFGGGIIPGMGVTAALLSLNGIRIVSL